MSFTCGNVYSCILWSKSIFVQKLFHQKSTKRFGKGNGWMNWWLVYVPDVLDWKLDKALMDSKLLFWDISIRSMSKTNYQFGSRLYLRNKRNVFSDCSTKITNMKTFFMSLKRKTFTINISVNVDARRYDVYRFTNICKILAQQSFYGWWTLI